MNLKLTYDPQNGVVVPDGQCEQKAKEIIERRDAWWIGSETLFSWIRLWVKRGLISPDEVEIYFNREVDGVKQSVRILIDKNGRLDNWPKGFFDIHDIVLNELIGWNQRHES
jgi:hypothetical protein